MALHVDGCQSVYSQQWCTNFSQPDISSLLKMERLLEVDIKELLVSEFKKNYIIPQDKNKSFHKPYESIDSQAK